MKIDLSIAEQILKTAKRLGADHTEVYMLYSSSLSIDIKSQAVEALERATESGYSIRVIKNGSLGFSYSNEPTVWKETLQRAIETSRFTEKDPYLSLASSASDIPAVEVFDKEIASLTEEQALNLALTIEAEALKTDRRIKRIRKASAGFTTHEIAIVNSEGLSGFYKGTSAVAEITLAAEDNNEAQMGWEYTATRRLSEIDFPTVGREAAYRALRLLGARKATTTKAQVLMEHSVVAEFLSVLAPSLSAENVQKGKSLLAGRKQQRVFSEKINIIDDGTLPWKPGTRPFDSEGIPSRKTTLVHEGTLVGYLYNLYTARKDSVDSTSNAIRNGIHTPPSVGISNLYIQASSEEHVKPYEQLIREIKRGMIVTEVMGVHTANPITGEFSVGATGLWVEDGEIKYPVKEAALSGTIIELFQRILYLSERLRFYGKIGASDILFDSVDISG